MTNRELVTHYLECFCAGDVQGVDALLAEDLGFKGTLHAFDSASDYLVSLRRDPPGKCGMDIQSITEDDDSVAVFYEYHKSHHTLQIAQLFRIRDCRIKDVVIVFDGRGLSDL